MNIRSETSFPNTRISQRRTLGSTAPRETADPSPLLISVIDPRTLERECFVECLERSRRDVEVASHASVEAWFEDDADPDSQVIVLNVGRRQLQSSEVRDELKRLVARATPSPVLVVGDSEDIAEMIEAFDCGAHSYIPSAAGFSAIVEATHLSFAGGVFLPLASIPALRAAFVKRPEETTSFDGQFTAKQLAVGDALRHGQSNKTIAYNLGLCESTVKVHVRNILKKLKATNRTEAAYRLNTLCFGDTPAQGTSAR